MAAGNTPAQEPCSVAHGPQRVRVFARQRPLDSSEDQELSSVTADTCSGAVTVSVAALDAVDRVLVGGSAEPPSAKEEPQAGSRRFHFDGAFDGSSSQDEVFQQVGLPVLKDVMRGFHGCVMAYGQTGSGKTHSLLNTGAAGKPEQAGLLPRLIATLFVRIGADPSHTYQVRVCAVQVYNEQVSDLLHPDHAGGGGQNLVVQSAGTVQGATWLPCRDPQAALKAFTQARASLVYAETKMNKASSRSHAVFQVEVVRYAAEAAVGKGSATATLGVLTVVDLAGSERVKRSGVVGQQMKEAININGSLLALGNVVQALAIQKKHVPFRDSKLTRLLEPALSGNCRTSLLVCVSPTLESAQETCHALEFASRAMRVEICAKVNEVDMDSLCNELSQLATVPVVEGADQELRQKSEHITNLEAQLTKSAEDARTWQEKSSQEAQRVKELQDSFQREAAALETKRQETLERSAAELRKVQEAADAEVRRSQRQASELSAEAATAKSELQAARAASEAALAAKQAEVDAARAEVARAKSAAAQAARECNDVREAQRCQVQDAEAKHRHREAELQAQLEALRAEVLGTCTDSQAALQAKAAEAEEARQELQRLQAAADKASAQQEAAMAKALSEHQGQVAELETRHQAHVAELEAAISRLSEAIAASRAELQTALTDSQAALQAKVAETAALRKQIQDANERSEEILSEAVVKADELRSQVQAAKARADAAVQQAATLAEELAAERSKAVAEADLARTKLAEVEQRLQQEEAVRHEERRAAEARDAGAEALTRRLQAELQAATAAASEAKAARAAAEAAFGRERAALETARVTALAAAEAKYAEELAGLVAAHDAERAAAAAGHAEELAALKAAHESAASELRWRIGETEQAYKVLQQRFDLRESRPDDVQAMARQRKTIRQLSEDRRQLDLELQNQLQTDKIFGGGERNRAQAQTRKAAAGRKLTASGSFSTRRGELDCNLLVQRNASIVEPIC